MGRCASVLIQCNTCERQENVPIVIWLVSLETFHSRGFRLYFQENNAFQPKFPQFESIVRIWTAKSKTKVRRGYSCLFFQQLKSSRAIHRSPSAKDLFQTSQVVYQILPHHSHVSFVKNIHHQTSQWYMDASYALRQKFVCLHTASFNMTHGYLIVLIQPFSLTLLSKNSQLLSDFLGLPTSNPRSLSSEKISSFALRAPRKLTLR